MKILVIEDSLTFNSLLKNLLSSAMGDKLKSLVLIKAVSTSKALNLIHEARRTGNLPDAIICDWSSESPLPPERFYKKILILDELEEIPFFALIEEGGQLLWIKEPLEKKNPDETSIASLLTDHPIAFRPEILRQRLLKIYVVEDSLFMRKKVRQYLKEGLPHLGENSILEFDDGKPALEALEKINNAAYLPDLILCDWMMPVVSGYDFLQKVRAKSSWRAVPFIMVTSATEKESVVEAIKAGVTQYISKPFTKQSIIEKVAAQLNLTEINLY